LQSSTLLAKYGDGTYLYTALGWYRQLKEYHPGAYAAFAEHDRGRLLPGMAADLVVLSRDILTVPETEILEAEVLLTMMNGQVVYDGGLSPAEDPR